MPNGEAAALAAWVQDLAAVLGAEVLVSDDADGFKTAADESGLARQVCTAHVRRNTAAWGEAITPALAGDADGSPAAIGVTPPQAVSDRQELLRSLTERRSGRRRGRAWRRSTGAIRRPPGHRRAEPRRRPAGCACPAWIAGICGGG